MSYYAHLIVFVIHRSIIRELPRVMTIYDVDMPVKEAKTAVAYHFRKHSNLKDGRCGPIFVDRLVCYHLSHKVVF